MQGPEHDEAQRQLKRLDDLLLPRPLETDVVGYVLEATAYAQGELLLDYIESALTPAMRRLRQGDIAGFMTRTTRGAHHTPSITVEAGTWRLIFEFYVFDAKGYVTNGWFGLRKEHFSLRHLRNLQADNQVIGALGVSGTEYVWRYVSGHCRGHHPRMWLDLPLNQLPPLLPDHIRKYLDYAVELCSFCEMAQRAELHRIEERGTG